MDKKGLISENKNSLSNWVIDGLLYGLASGAVMVFCLATFAILSGDSVGALLERFSAGGLTSPAQGIVSHLAVSAIYGVIFGALIWLLLARLSRFSIAAWLGGLSYGIFLLLVAQTAILPGTGSPLLKLPFWQWAVGHGIYGLVLGGLFARKAQ